MQEAFIFSGVLQQHKNSPDWGSEVSEILAKGVNRPKSGRDVGDHPPITPTKLATQKELDGETWKLYDYIARHFIGTVAKDCRYLGTTVTFKINAETFTTSGKTLIDPGYTTVMPWQVWFAKKKSIFCL